MKTNLVKVCFVHFLLMVVLVGNAQFKSEYDVLVYVNAQWKSQPDVNPELKTRAATPRNEQELVQFHLSETEKLLRKRAVADLSPALRANRMKNLDVLHRYLNAGVFPQNTRHEGRQPYFIDDNDVFCAAGYLMKESGAETVARDIHRTQNYSYLADIQHEKLMGWVQQSGLTFDELALIQPAYGNEWPATIVEFHYNNTGADAGEYIEIHQSSGSALSGMINFHTVKFYDNVGTLYKTLPIASMQSFTSGGHTFYYHVFPSVESFADAGSIELIGTNPFTGLEKLTTVFNYTSSSVQMVDHTSTPTTRNFPIGESESTTTSSSLNFCDSYRAGTYNLQAMVKSIGSINGCLILPVQLANFTYTLNNKKVVLNWETASEPDHAQYVVERSANGIDFENIETVPGRGGNAANRYQVIDASPRYVNHYRLKQIDAQGRIEYSKILYVKVSDNSPLQVANSFVTSNVIFSIEGSASVGQLSIYNINGQSMYTMKSKAGTHTIDVAGWTSGRYIIRLTTSDGGVYSGQFVKQ